MLQYTRNTEVSEGILKACPAGPTTLRQADWPGPQPPGLTGARVISHRKPSGSQCAPQSHSGAKAATVCHFKSCHVSSFEESTFGQQSEGKSRLFGGDFSVPILEVIHINSIHIPLTRMQSQ